MRIAALFGVIFATLSHLPMPASAASRVALVIGNSAYQNVPVVPNPVNDAADISVSLKRLDFDVKTIVNARYDDMRRALIDFGQKASGAEIAFIFFAGHGIQIDGENWLIPIDAQLATDLNVANETIGLQSLTRAVSNTGKLGLVVLDACRNNPFVPKMQGRKLTRAVDRGFSRVEPSDNVLVAYAARDGTTADYGRGRNSPFTQSLLKNIETPGLEVNFLFRIVRDDVMASTNRQQQPFVYGSLSREMIFLKPAGTSQVAAARPTAQNGPFVAPSQAPSQEQTSTFAKLPEKFGIGDKPSTAQSAPVRHRAVLYDENPADPMGQQYIGTVTWRTESIRGSDRKEDLALCGDIDFPERKLKMTLLLRRNQDTALPASHTAEMTFILPRDFAGGGVANVPGILLKSNEQARGTPLAGLAVKVTDGFFLMGLSNIDAERIRNIELLKERTWFDIPLVYANQRRAIIALEKGATGERATAQVFAAWGQ